MKKSKFLLPIIGVVSLIWFLIRVIPKPDRANYPCQRAAFPLASAFVIWLSGSIITFFAFKKVKEKFNKSNYMTAGVFLILAVTVFFFTYIQTPARVSFAGILGDKEVFVPIDAANTPVGIARGILPGRVVWVHDTAAANWDLKSNWWKDEKNDQASIDAMVSNGLQSLTGKDNDKDAWDAIFKYYNSTHGRGNEGYKKGEKIAIKINLNLVGSFTAGGNTSFPNPFAVLALTRQLVYNAGVSESDITFYDANRSVPDPIYKKCRAEFANVHFVGVKAGSGREKFVKDIGTTVNFSHKLDMEIGGGNTAYLPSEVSKATYMISFPTMKGHRYVGITFCAKNHFGTITAKNSKSDPASEVPKAVGLHPYVTVHDIDIPGSEEWSFKGQPMGVYNGLVDLMGHKDIGEKTLLFIVEGLYGVETEQVDVSAKSKWLQEPFNNDWTSSIFMSLDMVAIESVGVDFYRTEQELNPNMTQIYGSVDNYIHEAAQADNPPSETKYAPNGDGVRLKSLGVHEHWNNAKDKKYTRNLGTGKGIELVYIRPTLLNPTQLEANVLDGKKVDLKWKDNADNEDKYLVLRSMTDKNNFIEVGTLGSNSSSFTDEGVLAGNTYYYRVKAIKGTEFSPFSSDVKVEVKASNTGLETIDNKSISFYPNPIKDIMVLILNNELKGQIEFNLYSSTGQKLMANKFEKLSTEMVKKVDLSKLQSGNYFIEILNDNMRFSKQIIKR